LGKIVHLQPTDEQRGVLAQLAAALARHPGEPTCLVVNGEAVDVPAFALEAIRALLEGAAQAAEVSVIALSPVRNWAAIDEELGLPKTLDFADDWERLPIEEVKRRQGQDG